jgi:hypothetical protein
MAINEFTVVALHGGSDQIGTFCHAFAIVGPRTPPCPAHLEGHWAADGKVTLAWDAVLGADGYNVFGPTMDGPLLFRGHVQETSFVDASNVPGHARQYIVNATMGDKQSLGCAPVTVSRASVPFFPTAWSLAASVMASMGAVFLVLRRRP